MKAFVLILIENPHDLYKGYLNECAKQLLVQLSLKAIFVIAKSLSHPHTTASCKFLASVLKDQRQVRSRRNDRILYRVLISGWIIARCKRHVKIPDQSSRNITKLNISQMLPHTRIRTMRKSHEGIPVKWLGTFTHPSPGMEFIRLSIISGIVLNCVCSNSDGGVSWDESPVNSHTFGWSHTMHHPAATV
jgi:hypothetical protein